MVTQTSVESQEKYVFLSQARKREDCIKENSGNNGGRRAIFMSE